MFWYRFITILLLIIATGLFYSCGDGKITTDSSLPDTTKINYWKKSYDSLYSNYRSTRKKDFLKQGAVFADSILVFENQLLKDTGRQKIYFSVLFYRAVNLNDLENYIQSRELFDKYLYLYNQYHLSNTERLAYAQKTLADIYSRYGDYKKAILLLQQALDYYTATNVSENTASCILNLSIPFKELHRYDEAVNTLQKIFEINPLAPKRKAKACIELADIYTRQNKITEAGTQIKNAKQFLALMPYAADRTATYALMHNIEGDLQMINHDPQNALKAYHTSFDSAKVSSEQQIRNRDFGKLYIAMGKALEQLHLYDSAMQFYNRALYTVTNIDTLNKFSLPLQKDLYAENTIAEALYAKANCIVSGESGNVQKLQHAAGCYKLAFETEKKLLNAFSYDESRLNTLTTVKKETEKAIGVCYRLYKKTNDSRWADEAFLFAENNKSFVLNESVKRNTAASLFIQEDSTYTKMQLLQSRLSAIEIEFNTQQFLSIPDSGIVEKLLTDKRVLEEELLQNENAVKIKNPQYSNWVGTETGLTAGEIISKVVGEGTALVEYFTGDSAVYTFSGIKGSALSFYKLVPQVKALTDSFLFFFTDRNLILNRPAEYAGMANQLYSFLLKPYLPSGISSLLIIPDGFISFVPFDALLTGMPQTTDIASFPFLIKQVEIANAFSCKTLLAQQQIKSNADNNSIIAFAPGFINKERGLAPLLQSNEELQAIKEFYPDGKYFTGSTATLQQFKNNYTNAAIIHLATHANADSDSAIAGIEFYDSTLYLNAVYTMPLKARLVVLSGCETGTGNINKTEGLMSLARGFSYAGTQNVVAGLWQTEDKTSGELFKFFYSNLSVNTISGSLQKAKLQLLQNASVSQASPFYWAGYIYIGSLQEKINEKPGNGKIIIFILATSMLIGIGVIIYKRRINQVKL